MVSSGGLFRSDWIFNTIIVCDTPIFHDLFATDHMACIAVAGVEGVGRGQLSAAYDTMDSLLSAVMPLFWGGIINSTTCPSRSLCPLLLVTLCVPSSDYKAMHLRAFEYD